MLGACEIERVPTDSWNGTASGVKRDFHWIFVVTVKKTKLGVKIDM
jgi:hypothetical protein